MEKAGLLIVEFVDLRSDDERRGFFEGKGFCTYRQFRIIKWEFIGQNNFSLFA
jgi:hypothetical protein